MDKICAKQGCENKTESNHHKYSKYCKYWAIKEQVKIYFCRHKDKFLWSVFEDGGVLYECSKCGKRIEGENIGRIGYLGYLLKFLK